MKNKMRFSLLLAGVVSCCNMAFAQTVDQGKKFLYYQRYKSASDVFSKILASNPNNIDAIYYQGQALLGLKDSVAAEDLYSKALQTNGNAPLLLVGMGNIELRKGKTTDARQRFETAISLTKGKDINILNAVADANDDAKAGDATYAIEKLTQATQVKNFHDAETYVLMGDAYRKQIDGGNAVTAYNKALTIDPKLAEAKFKIGKIYETQNNKEFFLPAFEEAVTMDPNYAPALYELYYYWYNYDINKSKDYFNKYLAVSDPNPTNDYDKISILYASKDLDGAISGSKNAISTLGAKADPRYYKLIAYSYDAKSDSTNALDYMKQYFQHQKDEGYVPKDYSFMATLLAKFPNNNQEANKYYQLAIDKDTAVANKVQIAHDAGEAFRRAGDKSTYAYWVGISYSLTKNPNQNDLYAWGFAHYSAGNYKTADSIFCGIYESKYPTEFFGYYWCMKSKVAQDDSVGSQGIAVDAYVKLAQVCHGLDSTAKAAGTTDSVKYRKYEIDAYSQLAGYYNNIKKDKEAAIFWLKKILEVDPTNTDAPKFIEILSRPARQPAARPAAGAAKKPGGK